MCVTVAIHTGYRQTGAVYTRRSGSVQIQPDRPPISVRTRIGSNSSARKVKLIWIYCSRDSEWQWHQLDHMQVCILLQTDNHSSTPFPHH